MVVPVDFLGMPLDSDLEFRINLELGTYLISISPYRIALSELTKVKTQLQELLNRGFIHPKASPCGAPTLFIQKKNSRMRMYTDYRLLNKVTIKNKCPSPRIVDIFYQLYCPLIFININLRFGYCLLKIWPEHIPKTTLRTW